MPRVARIVIPGTPHHVTQRGNRRQQTFFNDTDYARYVDLLAEATRDLNVRVEAWCLMPNHVHLILVPEHTAGLSRSLYATHRRYTWVVNRCNGWTGHLWQSRYHSCPMDDAHFVAAIRYVELNPVRARLVERPEDWRWSSARGRVNGRGDPLVRSRRPDLLSHIDDWRAFLAECLSDEDAERIRQGERRGGVIGGPAFIARVERVLGRDPQPKPRGRPRRKIGTGRISLETSTTFDPA